MSDFSAPTVKLGFKGSGSETTFKGSGSETTFKGSGSDYFWDFMYTQFFTLLYTAIQKGPTF